MTTKTIVTKGTHGRSVRVLDTTISGRRLVRVQWREAGARRTESWPYSRENVAIARAYADGVDERLARPTGVAKPERLTVGMLGERFALAHPVPETWRPKTATTFRARWKVWLAFITPQKPIELVTQETLDEFRAAMRQQRYAVNQIVNHVQMVKAVWKFARQRGYLRENPLADYEMKLSKDQRRLDVPEWTPDECARIIAQLSPRTATGWRSYVAIVLDAVLGGRSSALLALEWRDVDMTARTITWRPELDKRGNERVQPLPRAAVYALRVAMVWRRRMGYEGPFILPAVQQRRAGKPYTYAALNGALHRAADAAGITWIDYRAMHGFRRMVARNVLDLTGNLKEAGDWIGDTDLRTLSKSYLKTRADQQRAVSAKVALPVGAPKAKRSARNDLQPNDNGQPVKAVRGGVTP